MNPNRLLRLFVAALLVGLLAAAVLQGCAEGPAEPTYGNPFDPDNPESANPFGLQALSSGGNVILTWTMLDGYGFTDYFVETRVESGLWTPLDTLDAVVGPAQYIFGGAAPTATNFFRVLAEDEFGARTSSSTVVPVAVDVPPIITNATGSATVASRFQDLTVAATVGDTVEVALDSLFAAPLAAPRSGDGFTVFAGFDLGEAAKDSTITVYARTLIDLGGGLPPLASARGSLVLEVAAAPTLSLAGGGTTIASPLVDLRISNQAVGVDSMRFATSEEGLPAAPWRPGAELALDVPVLDSVASQTIQAQFKRDFGFYETAALVVQADDLAGADFAPDLPANRISEGPEITLLHAAVATELRASQYPDFHDTGWVAYSDTSTIVLVPVADQYLYPLFTQYRNHWFQSTIRSDFALLGAGEVRVDFTNPLQGLIVEGGTTIEVTGTARAYDALVPIEMVQVHLGEGWEAATGTENWEATWDVPLFTEDTPFLIGALASAGDQTGQAWISVTVSQLAVTIAAPADAAQVTRGQLININGTAVPFLAGAPLDSVVVTVLDARLRSETLENWSVAWDVPTDATPLIDITAWAYAGDDSVSRRVQVTAVDPGK